MDIILENGEGSACFEQDRVELCSEQTQQDMFRSWQPRLAAAMLTCRLVSLQGCNGLRSLCDDEFGVMANCPGQMMRWVNRREMTDE